MRQKTFIIVAMILLMPIGLFGQTYKELWKEVEQAQNKDLPKTAISHLEKIEKKAQAEKTYGQLMRSTLLHAQLMAEVAPDSLEPAVARLEQQEQQAKDDLVLQAVYDAVLSQIYLRNHQLAEDWKALSDNYRTKALVHPDLLAQTKADSYDPFVVKGKHSTMFDDDLLSVVGSELNAWRQLADYYQKADKRQAACYSSLRMLIAEREDVGHESYAKSKFIKSLDSLIAIYGDLPEAGEIAMERYDYMDGRTDATRAEKAAWLQESIRRWGSWPRANQLRNQLKELTNPRYEVQVPNSVMEVGKPQTVRLPLLRHLQSLTMRVYRTKQKGDTELNPNNAEDYKKLKSELTELTELRRTLTFPMYEDYVNFEDSIQLDGLPAGVYMVEFQSQPNTKVSRSLYFVSGMRIIMQPQPDNSIRYVVVDATTGQPVSGATLRLGFSNGWRKPKTFKNYTPDSKGEVIYHKEDNKQVSSAFAFTKTDCYCPESNSYGRYTYYERQYNQIHTSLFTDRSIYRPGQTVVVTAVVWKEVSELDNQAVANSQVRLELRDANYKVVAEQQAVTDRFGKCSVQFTLPQGQLNGRFTIRANNGGGTSIRVEEYKRPTFQVEFPEYKESYQAGDTVHVEGKALSYAGVPVQDAKVKYTVRRRVAFWWLSYSWYWESGYMGSGQLNDVLYEGEAVTGDDGTFKVNMPLIVPKSMHDRPMYYSFVVEADVTDVAGETHSGTMSLPLGTKSTALTCDVPQQVRSDEMPKVTFSRCNAAGQPIAGQVKYRLDGGKWKECPANSQQLIANSQKLSSGEHRLEAECGDDKVDVKFVVFGLNDKKPATKTDDWFYVSDSQFPSDGKPVTVQVGASDPDLHIVYSVYSGNELLESGSVKKDGELINRKFTYKEEYGNGLLLTYAWVKNGQCHVHQHTICRPMPDKRLTMKWQTFRDRLTPGQQEEWQLKITKPDGTPADASLMAVLYDKSLDQIASHSWSFMPSNYIPLPSTAWQWTTWGSIYAHGSQDYQGLVVSGLRFSHFDSSVYPHYAYRSRMLGAVNTRGYMAKSSAPMVMESAAIGALDVKGNDEAAVEELKVRDVAVAAQKTKESDDDGAKQEEVQVRENLQETAFCYPTLQTDQDGQVLLKFTLPESLTTWRFMGVSNTTDMMYGYLGAEAVAKKDVMIQPNVPRFIRMGDEAEVSARIFNTSDHAVSGQAKLMLIDPETNNTVFEQEQSFAAESEKTASVTFQLDASRLSSLTSHLLICKVVAVGDGFSDGEQHYLPILPNSEYVTKTVPFTQHEAGVKTVDLTKLLPAGTTQQKLTIEYTNNPAWLMVQSLATIGQPWEHSAIDQAASYYSNLLAKSLLDQSPQVKRVFEQWKRESLTSQLSPLTSQLEKNQELKDIVLSETPWVCAADRESEQKQRLGDFFDENLIRNRLDMAVEKMKKLQNGDGSFSWYPEMPGSTMVTVAVEEMLTRLHVMTGEQKDVKQMADKAFNYIGKEMVDLVKEMKKREKKGIKPAFPSFTALRWLYICALDGRQLSKDVQNANDYLYRLLKKDIKRQTIYEKALTAIILSKRGDARLAAQYVQSLKEWTVFTEEMGRYYDTPRAGYSWYDYKIPTEVAAIEAIQTVSPKDVQTVDEMRRWLLQEKRTQTWDTPINSVNAIYAFLNGQSQQLTANSQQPTVLAIDGVAIETSKATAGVGYVKTAITNPQGATFTATKTSEGTSWGAVYGQFFQKTSDIEASQSGIKVTREVIAAKPQSTHTSHLSPLTSLKVGDRIKIRITIESTRDLDFVQVVDRRAACMEPVKQLSGYHNGAYCSPKDHATHYFYYGISKGKHVIETEYYIDRAGTYETGTCTVGCAYAPEYRATAPSITLKVKNNK